MHVIGAGVRSWESLFLGAELPQKLTASGVTVRGYLQCTACQGTSCARQCGQAQAVSSACWRLPDGDPRRGELMAGGAFRMKLGFLSMSPVDLRLRVSTALAGTGDCKWLSDRAMEQMRGLQEWQQPITQLRCKHRRVLCFIFAEELLTHLPSRLCHDTLTQLRCLCGRFAQIAAESTRQRFAEWVCEAVRETTLTRWGSAQHQWAHFLSRARQRKGAHLPALSALLLPKTKAPPPCSAAPDAGKAIRRAFMFISAMNCSVCCVKLG